MPTLNHVHKYRRHFTVKNKPYWRCVLPTCSHIIYQEDLIVGRASLCWICNEPMVIQTLLQAKPVCEDCKDERKTRMEKLKQIS